MAREKLKDFLRQNFDPAPNKISYKIDSGEDGKIERGDDLGIDPNTDKKLLDLLNENAGLLGDYVSYLVRNFGNGSYEINPGNEQAASTNRGDSIAVAEEQGASNVFASSNSTLGQHLATYSNSGYLSTEELTLGDIIDKTGFSGPTDKLLDSVTGRDMDTSGQTLVDTPGDQSNVIKASLSMLKNNNRFTGGLTGDPFDNVPESTSNFEAGENKSGTSTFQSKYGDYDRDSVEYVLDNVKSIGASLIYKMAGWDPAISVGDSENTAPTEDGLSILAEKILGEDISNVKGPEGRVPFRRARAKFGFGFPTDPASGDSARLGRGTFLSHDTPGESKRTYGSITTPATPAGGVNTKILRLQAAASIIAVKKAASSMIDLLVGFEGLKRAKEDKIVKKDEENAGRGPFPLGRNKPKFHDKISYLKQLALAQTDYPYSSCVDVGLKMLFGDDIESDDPKKIATANRTYVESPEFWLSVSSSAIHSSILAQESMLESFGNSAPDLSRFMIKLSRSRLIGFLNSVAIVGDITMKVTGGRPVASNYDLSKIDTPRNVDNMKDGPGTRHMKSRSNAGTSRLSLSWRSSSVPSMYMVTRNLVNTVIEMNTLTMGTNPLKGMVSSELYKDTYIDRTIMDGKRIPSDVIHRLENQLEAEYVPFYIHDIRTNEIISFHAFLTQLQDNITPSWSDSTGYGRMDPVQIYTSTKRTVQVGFWIVATSKEDFDQMWYKINKLTTMVYPQWTQGTKVTSIDVDDSTFVQPFSQVIGASPIVRLRVGDVIKSNYSKFNLARIFGIGDAGITPKPPSGGKTHLIPIGRTPVNFARNVGAEIFYGLYGTPLQYITGDSVIEKIGRSVISSFLERGFLNPLGVLAILNQLRSTNAGGWGYLPFSMHYIKANPSKPYIIKDTNEEFTITRPLKVWISKKSQQEPIGNSGYEKIIYTVNIIDAAAPPGMQFKDIEVTHDDICPNYSYLFNLYVMPAFLHVGAFADLIDFALSEATQLAGMSPMELDLFGTESEDFMKAENNPVVRSFESTMGRGLAGAIQGLQFDWSPTTVPWEIDWNSRAPMMVKAGFTLNVIHDIPPGLDHSGYNRAPLYNVGEIMSHVAGDPLGQKLNAEFSYRNASAAANKSHGGKIPELKSKVSSWINPAKK